MIGIARGFPIVNAFTNESVLDITSSFRDLRRHAAVEFVPDEQRTVLLLAAADNTLTW